MKNEIQKQTGSQLPSLMTDQELRLMYGELQDEDFKVPRLVILESLSPEIADGLGKEGEFFVKGLNQNLGKDPLEVVVLMRSKSRIKWNPLEDGGGISCQAVDGRRGIGDPGGECRVCPFQTWNNKEQPLCDLYENFIIILRQEKAWFPIAISGSRSRLSALRDFNTMLELHRYQGRPLFDKSYLVKIIQKHNESIKGSRYHVFQVVPGNNNQILPQEEVQKAAQLFKVLSQRKMVIEQDDGRRAGEATATSPSI